MKSKNQNDQMEPFFITEEIETEMRAVGHVFELPTRVTTTNARELYGLREGETVVEAIARQNTNSDNT